MNIYFEFEFDSPSSTYIEKYELDYSFFKSVLKIDNSIIPKKNPARNRTIAELLRIKDELASDENLGIDYIFSVEGDFICSVNTDIDEILNNLADTSFIETGLAEGVEPLKKKSCKNYREAKLLNNQQSVKAKGQLPIIIYIGDGCYGTPFGFGRLIDSAVLEALISGTISKKTPLQILQYHSRIVYYKASRHNTQLG
ncbi:MAG: hypothetical protein ACRC80_09280, partial [Waterburya sp.]